MVVKKEQHIIEFTLREKTGTGACRKIRSKNLVPVILYGPEYKLGLAGTVSTKAISSIANSKAKETTLIELQMSEGENCTALIRDVQRHLITQNIRHIDFYQVLKGHKIKVEIPIRIINEEIAIGVRDEGGLVNHITRFISIEVKPSDIPEDIVVDVAELKLGDEILVKDLLLPEDCELLTPEDTLVAHVIMPRAVEEEEEEEVEGEEAEDEEVEVEVVAKGKAKYEDEE